jgi:hypothetical protein
LLTFPGAMFCIAHVLQDAGLKLRNMMKAHGAAYRVIKSMPGDGVTTCYSAWHKAWCVKTRHAIHLAGV